MFTNVLVGIDGRQGGQDALALALMLTACEGTLTLAHVQRADDPVSAPPSGDFPVREIHAPSVASGLHTLAGELEADLIVVGACRRNRVERIRHGDDARSTLSGASCSVAIAPVDYRLSLEPLNEVGVGYDGRPGSDLALGVARRIAARHAARLSVFQALKLPVYATMGSTAPFAGALPLTVDSMHRRLEALGGVEPHAAYGSAAEELEQFSQSVDLLVLGSNPRGRVGRAMHGSTARALARTARCPLLVVLTAASLEVADPMTYAAA